MDFWDKSDYISYMSEIINFITNSFSSEQRLDKYLSEYMPNMSRSRLQALIKTGQVSINNIVCLQPSLKLALNSNIQVIIPKTEEAIPKAVAMQLNIVFEDDNIIVINKPAGLVVHPAPGHTNDTLVNAMLHHCKDSLSGIGGVKRPGIVHRLDKDTSGLIVVAKNDSAHNYLSSQFADRSLSRTYDAYVWGIPLLSKSPIKAPIGRHSAHRQKMAVTARNSKEAITNFEVVETYIPAGNIAMAISKIRCKLETGRTHQIRVHMDHIGHPLLGDNAYGRIPKNVTRFWPDNVTNFPRQALHAKSLRFIHPASNSSMNFASEQPTDLLELEVLLKNTC